MILAYRLLIGQLQYGMNRDMNERWRQCTSHGAVRETARCRPHYDQVPRKLL